MPTSTIQNLPPLRLAAIPHTGPYMGIGAAFQRLFQTAGPAGLFSPNALMLGVYHDDPSQVAPDKLRSHAALSVPDERPLPPGFEEVRLPGGRYGVIVHKGAYSGLPSTWAWIQREWMPRHLGEREAGPALEIYRNNPMNTPEPDLLTEICIRLRA